MFSIVIYILVAAIGFMMGFLYKRTHTTSQLFNPDPKKALKIFSMLFVLATVVTLVLGWLTSSSFQPVTMPEEGSIKFHNAQSVMVFITNFFFLILVVFANAYSQALKKLSVVPYLAVVGFYIIFILTDAYYISDSFALWQKSLQLFQANLTELHNTARMKCVLATLVIIFNAAMVWWGFRK